MTNTESQEERSMDPREPEEFHKAAKLEMGGICTQFQFSIIKFHPLGVVRPSKDTER